MEDPRPPPSVIDQPLAWSLPRLEGGLGLLFPTLCLGFPDSRGGAVGARGLTGRRGDHGKPWARCLPVGWYHLESRAKKDGAPRANGGARCGQHTEPGPWRERGLRGQDPQAGSSRADLRGVAPGVGRHQPLGRCRTPQLDFG